jgi:hypothetical protein
MTRQRSAELRAAEDRKGELSLMPGIIRKGAERAERWVYQISVEIEQKVGRRSSLIGSAPAFFVGKKSRAALLKNPGLGSPFLLHRLDVLATATIEDVNVRQSF